MTDSHAFLLFPSMLPFFLPLPDTQYQTIAMEFLFLSPLSSIPTAEIDIINRDDVLRTPSQSTIDSLFNVLAAVTANATACDVEIDPTLIDRPLGEGTGLRVVANFLEGLGAMQVRIFYMVQRTLLQKKKLIKPNRVMVWRIGYHLSSPTLRTIHGFNLC